MSTDTTSEQSRIEDSKFAKRASGPVDWLDSRLGLATMSKKNLRKVFPDHWSFMLGEIALWSFVVLLVSGVFLTFWFTPSMGETVYTGSYDPMRGVEMSQAYESTLALSFDIRGGLLMRQIHHWAAALFVASMMIHMFRVFFTGAYRKPREVNWLIGIVLLMLGMVEGMLGYSLPDDLLSGTGLRIMHGIMRSIPFVGSYIEFFVFGGEFPGELIIARFYILHVLLIPALILGLIAAHMLLLVHHKHTQWPGPGRTNDNVVGYPMLPVYVSKMTGFFFIVFGFTTLMAGLLQINGLWVYGPYNPAEVTAGSQPDWYIGFLEGSTRIMPGWETEIFGWTFIWGVLIPALVAPGILFTGLILWPWIERWITGDEREHHLLERPRNNPTRTAFGFAGITYYGVLWAAGANDVIALRFNLDIFMLTWLFRASIFVGPVIVFLIVRKICVGLQRMEYEKVLHGYETGIIERSPQGGYSERHKPISAAEAYTITQHPRLPELEAGADLEDENGVARPDSRKERLRQKARRFYYYGALDKPTRAEVEEAAHHFEGDDGTHEVTQGEDFRGISETGVPRDHD